MKGRTIISLSIYFIIFLLFMFLFNGTLLITNEYKIFIETDNQIQNLSSSDIVDKYGKNINFNRELLNIENDIKEKKNSLSNMDYKSDDYKTLESTINYLENNKYRQALLKINKELSNGKMIVKLILINFIIMVTMVFFILCNELNRRKISDITIIVLLTLLIVFNVASHGVVNTNSLEFILTGLVVPAFVLLFCYEYTVIFKKVKLTDNEE